MCSFFIFLSGLCYSTFSHSTHADLCSWGPLSFSDGHSVASMWLSHEACIQHSVTCLCEHLCVCFLGREHQSLGRSPERGFLSQLSKQSCQYAPSRLVRQTPTALRRLQYWLLLESFFPHWCFHCGFNSHMAADQWGWTPCLMMEQDWDLVQSVTWAWEPMCSPYSPVQVGAFGLKEADTSAHWLCLSLEV